MADDSGKKGDKKAGRGEGAGKIPTHPMVKKLAGEAEQPSGLVSLVGYFGPSEKEGHVRLYLGLDFAAYFEIPEDEVRHHEPYDPGNENGRTLVHVNESVKLDFVRVSRQSIEASYLKGSIASSFLGKSDETVAKLPGDEVLSTGRWTCVHANANDMILSTGRWTCVHAQGITPENDAGEQFFVTGKRTCSCRPCHIVIT